MSKMQVAFLFLVPDADPKEHRVVMSHSSVLNMTVIPVKDYHQAVQVSQELVEQGVQAIELCGGFGHIGLGKVAEAVGENAAVGAVRFDCHPSMGGKSGDEIFNS